MKEHLTFRDLNGRRRVRRFVKAAGFILGALLLVLLLTYGRPAVTASLFPASTPTPLATWTPTPVLDTPTLSSMKGDCPSDPAKWRLEEVPGAGNLKRIEPACVYDGLDRTVAWAMLTDGWGYTRQEAAQSLAFEHLPLVSLSELTVLTEMKGPMQISLVSPPSNPDLAEWLIKDGRPAVTFVLAGCFRTYEVVGNQRQDWGDGFPVICSVYRDKSAAYSVTRLADHVFSQPVENATRTISFFGYQRDQSWAWLGEWAGVSYDLAGLHLTDQDRRGTSGLYGAPLWDSSWLRAAYGLDMTPLPPNWWSHTADAEGQAILEGLGTGSP